MVTGCKVRVRKMTWSRTKMLRRTIVEFMRCVWKVLVQPWFNKFVRGAVYMSRVFWGFTTLPDFGYFPCTKQRSGWGGWTGPFEWRLFNKPTLKWTVVISGVSINRLTKPASSERSKKEDVKKSNF